MLKSMYLSGKMCFKIILNVTKIQGSTLSMEDTFFKKPQQVGFNLTPPPPTHSPFHPGILGLNLTRRLKFVIQITKQYL